MKRLRAFPITTLAALLAVLVLVVSRLSGQDIFESIVRVLDQVEHYEIDEIIAPCLLILGGFLLDLIITRSRQARAVEISAQRLGVFKATMRTVQDIVNNFQFSKQPAALSPGGARRAGARIAGDVRYAGSRDIGQAKGFG